jgi:hypothetical protein
MESAYLEGRRQAALDFSWPGASRNSMLAIRALLSLE